MLIFVAADHRGFQLKESLKDFLKSSGYEVIDIGNDKRDLEDDYPDFAYLAAREVAQDTENRRGIVFCGSGAGMDIVSNKIRGIRSVLAFNKEQAVASRKDDDTNILSLPADYVAETDAKEISIAWLSAKFSGEEKYVRRIQKIAEIEKKMQE